MNKFLVFPIAFILVLSTSCSDDSDASKDASNESIKANQKYQASNDDLSADEYMSKIENDTAIPIIISRSLDFHNDEFFSIYTDAWYDTLNKETVKLMEIFQDRKSASVQKIEYYLRGGKLVSTREKLDQIEGDKIMFIERITYYNDKEQPISSKLRKAEFEEDLVKEQFFVTEMRHLTTLRANQMINQEGPFATNFIGFLKPNENEFWLTVGDPSPQGFQAAMLVNGFNGDLQKLYNNPKAYVGHPLYLNFQIKTSQEGTYQLLMGAALK